MNVDKIRFYVNGMFATLPRTKEVIDIKQNILESMEDKYEELISSGTSEDEAFSAVIKEFGNIEEIKNSLGLNTKEKEKDFFEEETKSEVKDENGAQKGESLERKNIYSKKQGNADFTEKRQEDNIYSHPTDPRQKKEAARIRRISGYISGLIMLVAIISFFILGVFGYWHPAWLLFPLGGILCGIFGCVADIKEGKISGRKNFSSGACGIVMLLCLAIYLTMGGVWNRWHPFWMILLCGAFLCWLIDAIDGCRTKKGAARVVSLIDSLIMLAATATFFIGGWKFSLWHPLWVAFPIGGMLCGVVSIIGEIVGDKKND